MVEGILRFVAADIEELLLNTGNGVEGLVAEESRIFFLSGPEASAQLTKFSVKFRFDTFGEDYGDPFARGVLGKDMEMGRFLDQVVYGGEEGRSIRVVEPSLKLGEGIEAEEHDPFTVSAGGGDDIGVAVAGKLAKLPHQVSLSLQECIATPWFYPVSDDCGGHRFGLVGCAHDSAALERPPDQLLGAGGGSEGVGGLSEGLVGVGRFITEGEEGGEGILIGAVTAIRGVRRGTGGIGSAGC